MTLGRSAIISLVNWGSSEDLLKHFLEVEVIESAFTTINTKWKIKEPMMVVFFLFRKLIS